MKELARDAGATEPQAAALSEDGGATLIGRFNSRSRVRSGERVEVAVDTEGLHFFDPETGLGIYDRPMEEDK